MKSAFVRDKQIKKWRRQWKLNLIFENKPNWDDLWEGVVGASSKNNGFPPARQ